jgi:hypothetical protein
MGGAMIGQLVAGTGGTDDQPPQRGWLNRLYVLVLRGNTDDARNFNSGDGFSVIAEIAKAGMHLERRSQKYRPLGRINR